MKSTLRMAFAILVLALAMSGCATAVTPTPIPTIALDTNSSGIRNRNIQASAQVVPSQESRLSFVLPGSIKDIKVKEGEAVEAGQVLATLSSPELEYSVLQAEAAVKTAEFNYEYWKLPRREGNQIIERGPVAAQELEVSRRSLDTARAEFSQTEIVAPFAAIVTSIAVEPGEFVQPGQVVIILAQLDDLQIETTDLSELNIAAVKIGQPATVFVEALNEEFPGKVTAISPISDTIGGDVVYTVTIELDEKPDALRWGMSADVEIQTES